MHIAILTFEGYNELDSLIALGVLNRVRKTDWRVSIASPSPRVRSMNGVVIEAHVSLAEAAAADAVIVGSGRQTLEVVADKSLMSLLQLDPSRQVLGPPAPSGDGCHAHRIPTMIYRSLNVMWHARCALVR